MNPYPSAPGAEPGQPGPPTSAEEPVLRAPVPPGAAPGLGLPAYGAPPGYGPQSYPPQGYPPPGYLAPGYPAPPVASPAGPRPDYPPSRIDPIQGTNFGVAYAALPPLRSGPAVGALVAGISAVFVAFITTCFGVVGAGPGWGPLVAGAFAILGVLFATAAIVIGALAKRAVRRQPGVLKGYGLAQSGFVCGIVAVGIIVIGFAGSVLVTLSA